MPEAAAAGGMQAWLDAVRASVAGQAPHLLGLFDIYAGEAVFGRRFIAGDLATLGPQAQILEVGAGAMLLSCQLAREGWRVTSLEPTGSGFGHFEQLRAIVLQHASAAGCLPALLEGSAETLALQDCFDYAFSINVMEHVDDVEQALRRIGASLRPGASYRFTCPNYLFPYEPHFNIPTLFSKALTQRVLGHKIRTRGGIPDPEGLWRSLNWISVAGLRRSARRLEQLRMTFDTRLLVVAFERVGSDPEFARRRSPLVRTLVTSFVRWRLHRLLRWAPALLQPLIDCRVQRQAAAPIIDRTVASTPS